MIKSKYQALFVFILFVFFSSTLYARDAVYTNIIKDSNATISGKYTFEQCRKLTKKAFDKDSKKKKALIIGDSMACDFVNAVLENNYLKNYQLQVRFIPYKCQPILEEHIHKFIAAKDRVYCANTDRADSLKNSQKEILDADLIIFSSRWKADVAKVLPQTIHALRLKPSQKIVVIGNKNFGKIKTRKYLRMSHKELRELENKIDELPVETNAILSKDLKKPVIFIDPIQVVCGSDKTCPVFSDDLRLISYDGRHLTKQGARYVGKKLFQQGLGGFK